MTKRRTEPEKRPYDLGKRLEQISQSEIEHIMAVNFWGVCHSLKYSIAPIRQAGGGAMTVTASLAATTMSAAAIRPQPPPSAAP